MKQQQTKDRIEEAKDFLRRQGYAVDNLWSIYDVQQNYDCDTSHAHAILDSALSNDWITEQIFQSIDMIADADGIKLHEDD